MNEHGKDCERFEAMVAAWFEPDTLSAREREELTAHVTACGSCRESLQLSQRMEEALVSRRAEVPAADSFLPDFAAMHARARAGAPAVRTTHPRLVSVFRAVMSPAGVSITLVVWGALLALHFREQIARVFAWTASDRFSALFSDISNLLFNVGRGDAYTLAGIYVALAVVLLLSTGAITLRYIRHS